MVLKPERGQIALVNEQIDHTRKVILPDPLVQMLRKKSRLIPVAPDETRHENPPNYE